VGEQVVPPHLVQAAQHLRSNSLSKMSATSYAQKQEMFRAFVRETFPGIPQRPTPTLVGWFISHLSHLGYKGSTARTYVSALSFWSQDLGGSKLSKNFHIMQLLNGMDRCTARPDTRLPITRPLLHRLLNVIPEVVPESKVYLFQSMFLLAFFAFLRVGEMAVSGSGQNPTARVLQRADVSFGEKGLQVTIVHFKHNLSQRPFTITVKRRRRHCPVTAMGRYLAIRGDTEGPLFQYEGRPVRAWAFSRVLEKACQGVGLDSTRYKAHSFRIGAACTAMQAGATDAQIRFLGRWKSNAFLAYIRPWM
jgi:hypothetical protein